MPEVEISNAPPKMEKVPKEEQKNDEVDGADHPTSSKEDDKDEES